MARNIASITINEQISDEITRISSLITRRPFAFRNPIDTWNALKQLTGKQFSYSINDEISLDDLHASFIHDHSAPELEPLSLAMSLMFNEVNVTKAFQSLKLKSSSGHDGLSNLALKYAARELSAVLARV